MPCKITVIMRIMENLLPYRSGSGYRWMIKSKKNQWISGGAHEPSSIHSDIHVIMFVDNTHTILKPYLTLKLIQFNSKIWIKIGLHMRYGIVIVIYVCMHHRTTNHSTTHSLTIPNSNKLLRWSQLMTEKLCMSCKES